MTARWLSLPDSAALAGGDGARVAPSAERNAGPILAELTRLAPAKGRLLEIASGTGQHAVRFSASLPGLEWQPSDANPKALSSIAAWVERTGLPNLRPPVALDASEPGWGQRNAGYDIVLAVNLFHLISASEARIVLKEMVEAAAPGGLVLIYGPFLRDGRATSDGDAAFDKSLKAQDPEIGYKDVAWTRAQLHGSDAKVLETVAMPANNLMLVARRSSDPQG